jgi:hypothetical protein
MYITKSQIFMKVVKQHSVLKTIVFALFMSIASVSFQMSFVPAKLPTNMLGKFKGDLSYGGSKMIAANGTGVANIIETGKNSYSIEFNKNVPSIENVSFQLTSKGTYVATNVKGEVAGITISQNSLDIAVVAGTKTWNFSGKK